METGSFWDYDVWSLIIVIAVLLVSLLVANLIKKTVPFLRRSLIPASVLGGLILLLIASIYYLATKEVLFNHSIFGSSTYLNAEGLEVKKTGTQILEIITYHCLGIGFIAMALRDTKKPLDKKSTRDIFNSGCTTVASYLIQAIFGIGITVIFGLLSTKIFKASGLLMSFGYGQGTGQALNWGSIYEKYEENPFVGGANFGLTIAALGFLSASIGGVFYLNYLKKKGKVVQASEEEAKAVYLEEIQTTDEIPMNGGIDKITIQIAAIFGIYGVSYFLMWLFGTLVPGVKSIIYGFNFLIGTLLAILTKAILKFLVRKGVVKKKYLNTFMMNRIGGFAFDLMIVAGIAAIQIQLIKDYWYVLLVLGVVGAVITFAYNLFVANALFKDYKYEQFFAMYGMLTGTASTGVILLREIDPEFKTPASNNLIFQALPAIIFGFPMMFLAGYCNQSDKATYITLGICVIFFVFMNLILFRNQIFRRKTNK